MKVGHCVPQGWPHQLPLEFSLCKTVLFSEVSSALTETYKIICLIIRMCKRGVGPLFWAESCQGYLNSGKLTSRLRTLGPSLNGEEENCPSCQKTQQSTHNILRHIKGLASSTTESHQTIKSPNNLNSTVLRAVVKTS